MMKSELLAEYAPYCYMDAFHKGWDAYMMGQPCPYKRDSVEAQAWDRGNEACMRWQHR
jgi:hypothetical protein